jgi:hypothetical protein
MGVGVAAARRFAWNWCEELRRTRGSYHEFVSSYSAARFWSIMLGIVSGPLMLLWLASQNGSFEKPPKAERKRMERAQIVRKQEEAEHDRKRELVALDEEIELAKRKRYLAELENEALKS